MSKFGNLGGASQGANATETQDSTNSATINVGTTPNTTQDTAPVDGNPNADSASSATTLNASTDNGKDNSSGELTGAKPSDAGNSDKSSDVVDQNPMIEQTENPEYKELVHVDPVVATPGDLEQVQETGAIQGKIYSSHPVSNYQIGRFQFNNSTLTLGNDDDISEFEGLLKTLPLYERNKVRTLSIDAANALAIETGRITKGFDDGSSKAMEKLRASNPKTGGENMGTKDSGQNT